MHSYCYLACVTLWFVNFISLFFVVSNASTVVVDSPFGKIQGVEKTDKDTGLSYVSFKGIPYAKPPVGDLRFAKPQPHPKIETVFDATKYDRIVCPHADLLTYNENNFTEDCLVLNILTRNIESRNDLKKVLVFIHGGGFLAWTAYFFEAKSFVNSQDVIVVTINYRLGVLGFLSTENEASPGNYGLWDQTLALKWVKDNIRAFGGDPDDVTIGGESAGGATVGYLSLSPHTKGLFTKGYLQSGTATSEFARSTKPQSDALVLAKATGCWDKDTDKVIHLEDSKSIIECLRKVPFSVINNNVRPIIGRNVFVPHVDNDFIPDTVLNILHDDEYLDSIGFFDKAYLVGIDNNEVDFVESIVSFLKSMVSTTNDTTDHGAVLHEMITIPIMKSRFGPEGVTDDLVNIVSEFYRRRHDTFYAFVHQLNDINFLIPSLDWLMTASKRKTCNSYFFHFDHFPGFMKGSQKGMIHTMDLAYWFDIDPESLGAVFGFDIEGDMDEDDLELKRLFSSIIGEFTKTGNPGLALKHTIPSGWPKYDVHNSHYLNLNLHPWIGSFLGRETQDFWFKTTPKFLNKQRFHSEL